MKSYHGVILSGGGSKGPYGVGVLLGLHKFQSEKHPSIDNFYAGSSAGALSATMAAQGALDKLVELFDSVKSKDVLGTDSPSISPFKLFLRSRKTPPFNYFSSESLKALISKYAKFEDLGDANLLICVTNYLSGELETFYISSFVDEFVVQDRQQPLGDRRLRHYHRIEDQDHLVKVLLASAAIPVFFPPVDINGTLYVDGGIGNNTPLRQIAYFARHLQKTGRGRVEEAVCVINDPARFTIEANDESTDLKHIIQRTIDIFQNELVKDSLLTWNRINREVQLASEKNKKLRSMIESLTELDADKKLSLMNQIDEIMGKSTATTSRLDMGLLVIQPSRTLVDDILNFTPEKSKEVRHSGTEDFLTALEHRNLINQTEKTDWLAQIG